MLQNKSKVNQWMLPKQTEIVGASTKEHVK